jgi:hypothetical protein
MYSQMSPYRPVLYRSGSQGRYRAYPRQTTTPIPGAGYDADELAWSEQELDLGGGSPHQPYGNYAAVPLRGLGTLTLNSNLLSAASPQLMLSTATAPASFVPQGWDKTAAGTTVTGGSRSDAPVDDKTTESTDIELPPLDLDELESTPVSQDQTRYIPPAPVLAIPLQTEGFFDKKVGPVPVWALGLGGLVVVGGAATWFFMRKRSRR